MSDELVALRNFDNPASAHIAKTFLEDNDIFCILSDLHMGSLHSPGIGITLQVRGIDAERAHKLLLTCA